MSSTRYFSFQFLLVYRQIQDMPVAQTCFSNKVGHRYTVKTLPPHSL